MAVPYVACMALVASVYALPPRVLPAIQAVEGGQPGTVHHNADGSDDFGVMQVNTRWLPALAAYTHRDPAEVRARLIAEPCYNIAAAGAILRAYMREAGGNLMRAVGYYHSHTPVLSQHYQALVMDAARRLFAARE
ncbi:MAG TPA: lytic transglycosylase domain-containing protein [Acetobacteraceae bacterium]|nr:lytic transglycosylase domain-containing protein [Acetobacteraceae bacterium]